MNGVVFYRGISMLDGMDIVGIATLHSGNRKTGDMVQTWILRADVEPHTAAKSGEDQSICGDCPLRTVNGNGACYVLTFQGPRAVYHAWTRGSYPDRTEGTVYEVDGRSVRLGAYGDPAAIPESAWRQLMVKADRWTGYTHQWRRPEFQYLRTWCMASCDTIGDVRDAIALGWGTFYVAAADADLTRCRVAGRIQIPCPYERSGITCDRCGLCAGYTQRNIAVLAHGARASVITG